MQREQYNQFHDIIVSEGEKSCVVDVFQGTTGEKTITVSGKATFSYLVIIHGMTNIDIHIRTTDAAASVIVHALVLGTPQSTVRANIHTNLDHDACRAQMRLVSFLQTGTSCELNGGIHIGPGIQDAVGHLLEENIILGENVQIKTLPLLEVRSNNVQASHGARIHKLDPKKLFYAQSRGLSMTQAKGLVIGGYFDKLFAPIISSTPDMADKGHFETLKHSYFSMLMD